MDSGRHPQSGQDTLTRFGQACACQVLGPEYRASKICKHFATLDMRMTWDCTKWDSQNTSSLPGLLEPRHARWHNFCEMDKWRRSWQACIRSTYLCKVLKTWTAPGRGLRLLEISSNAGVFTQDYNSCCKISGVPTISSQTTYKMLAWACCHKLHSSTGEHAMQHVANSSCHRLSAGEIKKSSNQTHTCLTLECFCTNCGNACRSLAEPS